ncbi:MAG: MFS transporter, partial [Paraburkholderia nemoris]
MNPPSLSANADASSDAWLEAVAQRKITWRIMPFLFLVYVLSYLDRVNIG